MVGDKVWIGYNKPIMKMHDSKILKSKNFDYVEKLIIALHGYGSCGEEFYDATKVFIPDNLKNAIFLFPNGPIPCDIGMGYQWFHLEDMSYEELRAGLELIAPIVCEYIGNISKEYACNNINLIGFSQGAITCFEILYYISISKIIAYSGLFAAPKNKDTFSKNTSVLIIHSNDDMVVPYKNAKLAQESLDILGINSKIMTCNNIGHSISETGWKSGFDFLN
ncbi:MAG: hypothetical protein LBU35_03715 [Holosporales bacterium]|jgi:predicted esterase|nr:hypothetical protein [Holosporales bacterium]